MGKHDGMTSSPNNNNNNNKRLQTSTASWFHVPSPTRPFPGPFPALSGGRLFGATLLFALLPLRSPRSKSILTSTVRRGHAEGLVANAKNLEVVPTNVLRIPEVVWT